MTMRRKEPRHHAAIAPANTARRLAAAAVLVLILVGSFGCSPHRAAGLFPATDPAKTGSADAAGSAASATPRRVAGPAASAAAAPAPADAATSGSAPADSTIAAAKARPLFDPLPDPLIRSRIGGDPALAARARPSRGAPSGDAAAMAEGFLGTPYVFGGSTPRGFDCSGLVQYVYKRCGVELPRRAIDQSRVGRRVGVRELRRNDLIFFRTRGQSVSHVGIYAGGGRFIHAPGTGKHVRSDSLENPWWRKRVMVARRLL